MYNTNRFKLPGWMTKFNYTFFTCIYIYKVHFLKVLHYYILFHTYYLHVSLRFYYCVVYHVLIMITRERLNVISAVYIFSYGKCHVLCNDVWPRRREARPMSRRRTHIFTDVLIWGRRRLTPFSCTPRPRHSPHSRRPERESGVRRRRHF